MGVPAIWLSFLFAIQIMFDFSSKPDINDAPWDDIDGWTAFRNILMTWVGNLIMPEYFFLCQFLTWGQCDISETALIYMDKTEAVMWFLAETLVLPLLIPEAIFFTLSFATIYSFQSALYFSRLVSALILDDSGDDYD